MMRARGWTIGVLLLAAGVSAAGCDRLKKPEDPQALRSRVLAADPKFSGVVKQRDELANRIQVLHRELQLTRTQIEDQITALRAELQAETKQTDQQVQELKNQLQPEVERVELTLAMAREELKGKRRQRGALGRSISRLRKSIKQATAVPPDERTKLDQELGSHLEETTRLDKELAALAEHIKLLDAKRRLLKL
jgi:chromosome segregation ATPase